MMRSVVTEPLLSRIHGAGDKDAFDVIISVNELFKGGIGAALELVAARAKEWNVTFTTTSHYVFARLSKAQILHLAQEAGQLVKENGPWASVVYRIWEDSEVEPSLNRSLVTIKADAAQRAFQARGDGIVWAVLDSGIQGTHPHFQAKQPPFGPVDNLKLDAPLGHLDFTPLQNGALVDEFGHGTHVAGIIAGSWTAPSGEPEPVAGAEVRSEQTNEGTPVRLKVLTISGVAPRCRLLSLKVIADRNAPEPARQAQGKGKVSWVLKAIDKIQEWNQHGKRLLVHGVNMSLGYDFDPRWFGCGQSPICVEVNRLVKSGVAVVVSAGNAGYQSYVTAAGAASFQYKDLSITDPGNADLAVTVGSTHREMPHLYGVSYFSSRGPTGDGRMKPDLVAPGERILSCAAGAEVRRYGIDAGQEGDVLYCEQTGTSMSAPHVSGAMAAFLSVRREFIGQPERLKEIFVGNTVDLRRERRFQGAGLLDLMRVLQAV
jgi:subtilisin family serine protease